MNIEEVSEILAEVDLKIVIQQPQTIGTGTRWDTYDIFTVEENFKVGQLKHTQAQGLGTQTYIFPDYTLDVEKAIVGAIESKQHKAFNKILAANKPAQ